MIPVKGKGTEINIEVDVDEVVDALSTIEGDRKKITRSIVSGIGNNTRNAIKKDYKLHLHKRSGNLYKNIKKKMNRQGDTAFIASWAKAPTNKVHYGFVITQGGEFKTKHKDSFFTFKIDDKWIKTHEVRRKPNDYLVSPAEKYFKSPKYKKDLDNLMHKQLEKSLKKKGLEP